MNLGLEELDFETYLHLHKAKVRRHLLDWLADLQDLLREAPEESPAIPGIKAAIAATLETIKKQETDMQVNFIDMSQLADLLETSELLQTIDHDGQLVHILHYSGSDLIAVVNPITGGATCIYPCMTFDAESGGSIHDQARALLAPLT